MAPPADYSPTFSEEAAEFLLALPRRRQRILMDRTHELARQPFLVSDYFVHDADGHMIEHLLVDGFLIAYWVDHAAKLVMIVEVDDVR